MKKLIISVGKKLIVSVGLVTLFVASASAYSTSTQIQVGALTNLFSAGPVTNGSFVVNQIILTANSTNSTIQLVDTPNGALTYTQAAYTNRISYATNYITLWTNYYGVVQSTTNLAYVDFTNNIVPAVTNNYPVVANLGAAAGTSTVISGAKYVFQYGIWATNTGSGLPTLTINYNTP